MEALMLFTDKGQDLISLPSSTFRNAVCSSVVSPIIISIYIFYSEHKKLIYSFSHTFSYFIYKHTNFCFIMSS